MTQASTASLLTYLLLYAIAFVVVFVALVRIVVTPGELWAHGRLSKAAWIVGTVWFIPTSHGVAWPLAAAAAIWHTGRLNRRTITRPTIPDLPFAPGEPEPPATSHPASTGSDTGAENPDRSGQ